MQLGSERTRIPSLETNYQKNLEEKTKEVNDILRLIHTNNITETNNLVHAGARMAVELMKKKKNLKIATATRNQINHPGKTVNRVESRLE